MPPIRGVVVLAEGVGVVGETVTLRTANGRRVTWFYVTDPEGNIVELQSWWDASPEVGAAQP